MLIGNGLTATHIDHKSTSDRFTGAAYRALAITAAAIGAFTICVQPVAAQALPPACAQIARAVNACSIDMIHFLELTDPAKADELKRANVPEKTIAQFRQAIKEKGAAVVAQKCAAPEGKQQIVASLFSGIVVPLRLAGAQAQQCEAAVSEIR
ncbi:MAG TPA: hypothetical protein VGN52_24230 [Burkholderiales bacterium]|jgi:hypothetical protein